MTSAMVGSALDDAHSRGLVPSIICGDLSQHLGQLDLVPRLAIGGWMDLGAPAPTCRINGEGRRIDVKLANPAFQAKAGRIGLDRSSRVTTHCLQWVDYSP
eukprot:16441931-Heterocapsa_arctica.AAC.1